MDEYKKFKKRIKKIKLPSNENGVLKQKFKTWSRNTNRKKVIKAIIASNPIGLDKRIPITGLMEITGLEKAEIYGTMSGVKRYFRNVEKLFLKSAGRPKGYYIVPNKEDSIPPLDFDCKYIENKVKNFIDFWQAAMYHLPGNAIPEKELNKMRQTVVKAVMGW